MKKERNPYIAKNLSYLRKKNGYSQQYVADAINKSDVAIYYWENGKREPLSLDAFNLSQFYNVSIDDLLTKDLLMEDAKESGNIKELSPKELNKEVKALLLRTGKLTDSEKVHIVSTLDLICNKGGDE